MTPERWLAKPRAKGKRCPGCDERPASPVLRLCSTCKSANLGRHKACQHCGKPKEGEPFYDAPEDEEVVLTDSKLIKQATAGPDWECAYCGSHQRRDSGECAQCGAEQGLSRGHKNRKRKAAMAGVLAVSLIGLLCYLLFRTRIVDATVTAVAWTYTVHVDRYQVTKGEGFDEDRPGEAFDVKSVGSRRLAHG
jgi:predicted nucleic acid-binding Zn ribbon protein